MGSHVYWCDVGSDGQLLAQCHEVGTADVKQTVMTSFVTRYVATVEGERFTLFHNFVPRSEVTTCPVAT